MTCTFTSVPVHVEKPKKSVQCCKSSPCPNCDLKFKQHKHEDRCQYVLTPHTFMGCFIGRGVDCHYRWHLSLLLCRLPIHWAHPGRWTTGNNVPSVLVVTKSLNSLSIVCNMPLISSQQRDKLWTGLLVMDTHLHPQFTYTNQLYWTVSLLVRPTYTHP